MTIGTILGLLAALLLVLATSFFVAAEFAMVAVERSAIEARSAEGNKRSRTVAAVLKRLSFHLSGAQLGITITSVVLGFVAEPTIADALEPPIGELVGDERSQGVSVAVALLIATVFSMVVGELIPKNVAIARPLPSAEALAGPLRLVNGIFRPIISLTNGVANRIVRLLGMEPKEELVAVRTKEELGLLIHASGAEGTLDPEEVTLLERTIRFGDKTASDALIPRTAIVALSEEATVADLVVRSVETGFSRFPVYRTDLDEIIGVVQVRAVYSIPAAERDSTVVTKLMGEVFVVPEGRALEDLLRDMRAQRESLAVVVDEYGGTAGIVSLEDLLEEIVGEIDDEFDPTAATPWHRVGRVSVLPASLHPDEVEELCGLRVPEGDYETLAGFVLQLLGHIPTEGERVEHDGWVVEVVEMDRLRIATVRVEAPAAQAEDDAHDRSDAGPNGSGGAT